MIKIRSVMKEILTLEQAKQNKKIHIHYHIQHLQKSFEEETINSFVLQ